MLPQSTGAVKTPNSLQQNPDIFRQLAAHLWRGGQVAHYWTKAGNRSRWFAVENIPSTPQEWAGLDVYFGVHPCTGIPTTNAKGEKQTPEYVRSQAEYIAALNCVYADFDAKDFPGGEADILAHLNANLDASRRGAGGFPYPSVIVASGGGLHCYWLLEYTFNVHSDEDRHHAEDLEAAWVRLVGGDKSVNDLPRVLRVPGTFNHKYNPARPVAFLECNLDRLYARSEFEALTAGIRAELAEERSKPKTPAINPLAFHPQADDITLLQRAMNAPKNGQKFTRLWVGDASGYVGKDGKPDLSTADQALVNLLAFWTAKDAGWMDRLFRQSGLYREKWERDGYREATIAKAIGQVRNVYNPRFQAVDMGAVAAAIAAVGMNGRGA